MKILEKTPNKLVCQSERNVGTYVLFLIGELLLVGILLFAMFSTLTSSGVEALTCKRVEPTQVDCELTQSTYMGLKKEPSISLGKVMGAKANGKTDSEGDTFYEVIISTQKGEFLFSHNNPNDALKINNFIKYSNLTDLKIDYDNRWNFIEMLVLFLLVVVIKFDSVSFIIYNMTVVETYIFDKAIYKLIQQQRSCLDTKVKEYTFREVVDVDVEKIIDGNGNISGYRVSLLLTGSKCLILRDSLFFKMNNKNAQELANTIANFINISNTK